MIAAVIAVPAPVAAPAVIAVPAPVAAPAVIAVPAPVAAPALIAVPAPLAAPAVVAVVYTQALVNGFIANIDPTLPADLQAQLRQQYLALLPRNVIDRASVGHLQFHLLSANRQTVVPNDTRLMNRLIDIFVTAPGRLLPHIVQCLLDSTSDILIPGTEIESSWTKWRNEYATKNPEVFAFMLLNPVLDAPQSIEEKAGRVLLTKESRFVQTKAAGRIANTQLYLCRPLYTPPQPLQYPKWQVAAKLFIELGREDLVLPEDRQRVNADAAPVVAEDKKDDNKNDNKNEKKRGR